MRTRPASWCARSRAPRDRAGPPPGSGSRTPARCRAATLARICSSAASPIGTGRYIVTPIQVTNAGRVRSSELRASAAASSSRSKSTATNSTPSVGAPSAPEPLALGALARRVIDLDHAHARIAAQARRVEPRGEHDELAHAVRSTAAASASSAKRARCTMCPWVGRRPARARNRVIVALLDRRAQRRLLAVRSAQVSSSTGSASCRR